MPAVALCKKEGHLVVGPVLPDDRSATDEAEEVVDLLGDANVPQDGEKVVVEHVRCVGCRK